MTQFSVYGVDHSPWVQAVLLGLHEANIDHSLTTVPPLASLADNGIMMPTASIDGGPWQRESADILQAAGFSEVDETDMQHVQKAWQGVLHRPDSIALFFGNFSLASDTSDIPGRRFLNNFLRSFLTCYFCVLIYFLRLTKNIRDPENFGDQFMHFENKLNDTELPFFGGEKPDTLDFLLFGIIQCHCSIYVPPVSALQSDERLKTLRKWIGAMQERFSGYDRLYSPLYFAPFRKQPKRAHLTDRFAFWLGTLFMVWLWPLTLLAIAGLAIWSRRGK